MKFSSTFGLVDMACLCISEEVIGAQECVCVCAWVFATVCVASALCERWCENASRAACVSSASNMRKICGTYLQSDTSQNDMTQPCYTRAMRAQPAGTFLKQRAFQRRKNKKNRACLKLCVVALLNPKKEEVRPHVSAHGIPKVLNSQGDSCHIHLISLRPFPARYLRTNRSFFFFCCVSF